MSKYLSPIRVFVNLSFEANQTIVIDSEQARHIIQVMRCRIGDKIYLFNGFEGEWCGSIQKIKKNSLEVLLESRVRAQVGHKDLNLFFAPVKRSANSFIVQKATELGASGIFPVITDRTNLSNVNIDRLITVAVGAAEQSRRMTVPSIAKPEMLKNIVLNWPISRKLYVFDKNFDGDPISSVFINAKKKNHFDPAFLIGPEGGLTIDELELLCSFPFVRPAHLGPRILRSETSVVSVLAIWQALCGDWS